MEGVAPGVQSYSASGQPGDDASIIRGVGSINYNQSALIVVDGVPYLSALSTINPLDIGSVVVLKDATANGVVFVTPRKAPTTRTTWIPTIRITSGVMPPIPMYYYILIDYQ